MLKIYRIQHILIEVLAPLLNKLMLTAWKLQSFACLETHVIMAVTTSTVYCKRFVSLLSLNCQSCS